MKDEINKFVTYLNKTINEYIKKSNLKNEEIVDLHINGLINLNSITLVEYAKNNKFNEIERVNFINHFLKTQKGAIEHAFKTRQQ
jgi:hypothetical protein